MIVSLIAAMAENRVIGRSHGLPWHLPADLQRFKALTMGHTVILGRKTFQSIGRVLPGRRWVVLTRDPAYRPAGVEIAPTLDEALRRAAREPEVFIAGGGDVFAQALPRADRLYLTLVHAEVSGDTRFPELPRDHWRLVEEQQHAADDRHAYPFSFQRYERVSGRR